MPGALAADHDLASPPVHVIELQCRDLTAAQPEPSQQHQDREVPPAGWGVAIAALEQQLTWPAASPRGRPSRRLRTDGTAAANGVAIQPCTCRNRSSERSAHTINSAARCLRRRASRNTNAWISRPDRPARSSAIGSERSSRNRRATGSYSPDRAWRHPALHQQIVAKLGE